MQKVCEFLKSAGTYYLATVEGDQPRVRPFGTAHIFEGKLYIQTGKSKPVSRQIAANPKCEIFEEADELSQALQFGSGDYLYLESQANKALKKRRLWDEHQKEFEQKRRKATQRAAADERRRIDDWWIEWERKHLHKQEEPIEDIGTTVIPMNPDVCFENNGDTQNTEDQRFLEEARRKAEEQRCLEEERRKAEEQRRLEEERRKAEEQRRLEEECRKAEEQRRLEEEHQRLEEQHRLEEESRKAEEQRRLEDEQRKVQELRRLEEERRRAEEQRRLEEERHKAEEQHRLEEERRKAEEQHLLEEERRKAEEQYRFEQELVRRKENYRAQNLCQYCGGRFKGFFKKVCSHCGRNKDY